MWNDGYDALDRHSRQVVELIGLAATVVSAISSVYTTRQLESIQSEVKAHDQELEAIVFHLQDEVRRHNRTRQKVQDIGRELAKTAAKLDEVDKAASRGRLLESMVLVHTAKTTRIKGHLQAALAGQFPIGLVETEELEKALATIQQEAETKDYSMVVTKLAQVLELRTSYIYSSDGLSVVIHVPLASATDHLQLQRLEQVPQPLQGEVHGIFQPTNNILAISKDNADYRILSTGDLAPCTKLGMRYWCDTASVTLKTAALTGKDGAECLVHLFLRDQDKIQHACPISLTTAKTSVTPLTNSEFLTSAARDSVCTVTCGQDPVTHQAAEAISTITLKPGCRGKTTAWEVVSRYDYSTETKPSGYSWPKDLHNLLDALKPDGPLDLSPLHELIDAGENDVEAWEDLPLAELKRHRGERIDTTTTRAFGLGTAGIALAWLIIISVVGTLAWRRWKNHGIVDKARGIMEQMWARWVEERQPGLPVFHPQPQPGQYGLDRDLHRDHLRGLLALPAPGGVIGLRH
jgi:hypothetical protein